MEDLDALSDQVATDEEELDRLVDDRDWEGLVDASARLRHVGEDRLRRHLAGRKTLNRVTRAAEGLETQLTNLDQGPGTPEREEIVSKLRGLNEAAEDTVVPEALVKALEGDEISDLGEDTSLTDAIGAEAYAEMLDVQRDLAIWYAVAGYAIFGRAVTYHQLHHAEPNERLSQLDRIEGRIEAFQAQAMERFGELYAALVGRSWDRLDAAGLRASAYPISALTDLSWIALALREGRRYEAEVDENPGQEAMFASAELELHRTYRLLALLLGAGHQARFTACRAEVEEEPYETARTAADKRFNSLVRDGVNVDIDELAEDPSEFDGRFVEVEGFVDDVRVETGDGYATRFDLVDRLHETRLPVYYGFRNLRQWHLHEGAFARVQGDFVAESEHVEGPEIEGDIVNVGQNGDESWFDALTSDFASREVYELYPAHANLIWSLEPPTHGGAHA